MVGELAWYIRTRQEMSDDDLDAWLFGGANGGGRYLLAHSDTCDPPSSLASAFGLSSPVRRMQRVEVMKTRSNLLMLLAALLSVVAQCSMAAGVPGTSEPDLNKGPGVEPAGRDTSTSSSRHVASTNFWATHRSFSAHTNMSWALRHPPVRRSRPVLTVVTNPPGGVGLLIAEAPGGGAVVKQVVEGTPAWEKGLRDGDLIVGIDSQSTIGMPLSAIAMGLRGPIESEVSLTVSRPVSGAMTFSLRREAVSPPAGGFRFVMDAPDRSLHAAPR